MSLRILHIAPFNISGVPITFVHAERRLGFESRLVTMGRDRRQYEEDICLDLPFLDFSGTRLLKRLFSHPSKLAISNTRQVGQQYPVAWQANGFAEALLVRIREWFWTFRIRPLLNEISFWDFDFYQLDGGLEFYRDGRLVRALKERGKRVICCYTGSDLRTRGVIPAIDQIVDLNVTLEHDHLQIHPNIRHVLFPFETYSFSVRPEPPCDRIVIGHAPTNRQAKGSDRIIAAVEALKAELSVELLLVENMSYRQSLEQKARCHIFVDQIGDLGYGLNSLESLAMGIATCSCLADGFEALYPDHPFVVIDHTNIEQELRTLIMNTQLRRKIGEKGRAWVQRNHNSLNVVKQIHRLAGFRPALSLSKTEKSSL